MLQNQNQNCTAGWARVSLLYSYRVQDGKGPIDGNFATTMNQVSRFCAAGNSIVAPVDTVKALTAIGGVNISIAEMVCISRKKINKFGKINSKIMEKLSFFRNDLEVRFDSINLSIMSKASTTLWLAVG